MGYLLEISLLLLVIAEMWYIYTILKNNKKPSGLSWFLYALINGVIFLSLFIHNEQNDIKHLIASLLYFIFPLIIFALTFIVNKEKEEVSKKEIFVISIITLATVCIYFFFKSPIILLIGGIIGDFFASYPTIKKSWIHPDHEPVGPWILNSIGFMFAGLYSLHDLYALFFYAYASLACFMIGILPIVKKYFK